MKVIEHLARAKNPFISFELIPLSRGGDIGKIFSIVEELLPYNPPFIDITSHAAEVQYEETPTGEIRKKVKRKKPGTIGISVAIKNKFNIDTVPHILCRGFTKEETEDALIELNYLGIENVLAVRGDDNGYRKPISTGRTSNDYACDLVQQISDMNKGRYLDEDLLNATPTNFCIGVGAYPEKHFEAPNLRADLKTLKQKIAQGADYIVTQMFYNNNHYFDFVKLCREEGITVPIIPGLKVISTRKHLTNIPANFYIEIPTALSDEIESAKPEHIVDIGAEWSYKQCVELLEKGAPSIHFYVMQNIKPVKKLLSKLKL